MRVVFKYSIMLIASICMAIGIHFFLMPHFILDGGIMGVALLFNYLWGIRVGFMILLCSFPIFLWIWPSQKALVRDSFLGLISFVFFFDFFKPLQYFFIYHVTISALWSSLIGGILLGMGYGLMLRHQISTGGLDLCAHVISQKYHWNAGILLLIFDIMVISFGGVLISLDTFVYSMLTVILGGFVTCLLTIKKKL